ncbi:MAG: bifunctional (p)ppGpp synthetase/guanosine-3',5'-bis(diphosphate) 3'-pyrophosphohydrolase [Erysipelotrichaceae bacterium]|nr:bifunctional (p)ppGpp synthetase/guanosine-3',5'-bis(diphosphate) 3'-pyrophosphohydrolase [Erysipelotrichaceae bacterium]
MSDLFNEALAFAMKAHEGVTRKGVDVPFILHPMEVACIVATMTENKTVMAAGLLHDTVEDAEVTIEEIRNKFGEDVAKLVESETEDKMRDLLPEDSWDIRKKESLNVLKAAESRNIKILWLSDKLSNMRSFYRLYLKKGDDMWESFHQRDVKKQEWYYRKVYEYTSELAGNQAYTEYGELIEKVFGRE